MLPPYAKPFVDIPGQLALLQSRGLVISDPALAREYLKRIGYYRLSAYWFPFRERIPNSNPPSYSDQFKSDSTFQQCVELYVFDKRLRLLFLDAIERIEVSVRVEIALLLGRFSPFAYADVNRLDGKFSKRRHPASQLTSHDIWLRKLREQIDRSKEDFVVQFKSKYGGDLPIWIAIELWDFGLLSNFCSGILWKDRTTIASRYGIRSEQVFCSWLRAINHIRNVCAHHSRLWNRSPADQPKLPHLGDIPLLDHLVNDSHAQSRIYSIACILQFLLRTINPQSSWKERLKELMGTLPQSPHLSITHAGFPETWKAERLWN